MSGDDCLATDQANAVYLCNLAGSQGVAPLQADVWKSTDHGTTWAHGAGAIPQCATSCSPFGVDRDWVAASIPPGGTTRTAEVVLMYHDFYGPSQIWVNISHDGGATFGPPQEVLASPAVKPGAVKGTLVAQGYTFCNTVPAGVGIVKPGLAHAGRIYVAWIAADLAQNATGCNISMLQSFHTLWLSWSDDHGLTWTPQQAFDAGIGHDASTPFVGFTLDDQGNPYFGFAINLNSNPATCSAESSAGTVQSDPSCEYDMYVVWSHDGGATWDGGGGLIPGSAARAYRVNPAGETGTHFFPAIAAGDPGQVDVAYLRTTEILPTDPFGKADPGGCAGPGPGNGNPTTYPPACSWNLYAAQSLNLTASPATATWTVTPVTTTPMHVGDICNLGIACVAPSSNRNLLDFIQETLDPQGCAHIAYADDNTVNKLRAANQTSGTCIP
ncbi:MAG TPA: sialidase family protein [Candidatus Sulfotelmatobacter sp.]|nr:sialidase family protein [Candidatus Sulfotelmatobacter sp.]